MKIVFIHGRSQQGKDSLSLKQEWEEAFDKGMMNAGLSRPEGLEIVFPYYGDKLQGLVDELDAPLVQDVLERGASQDDDEAEFRGQFLMEVAEKAGITSQEINENYEGEIIERGPLNWKWVRAIMKTLDKSNKISEAALDRFTRDVYVYMTNRNVSKEIDGLVESHIGDEPCVVVGHSLGSIVGYNVLKNRSLENLAHYITVGSPLGSNAVKQLLASPLVMPVQSWCNAMDSQDPVALYPLDSDHFDVSPSIENYTGVDNTTDNQHGIIGYLPDPWVAKSIHYALTQQ